MENKKVIWIVVGIAIIALIGLLFIVNYNETNSNNEKLMVAMGLNPMSAPIIVAQEKGIFANNEVEIQIIKFSSGKEAVTALLSGSVDLATAAEPPIAYAILREEKIVLTDALVTESDSVKFIGNKSSIEKPKDIEGKKIAVFLATGAEYFMDRFFEEHGIDSSKVEIINLKPSDMPIAFLKNEIDGYFIWEPNVWKVKKELGEQVITYQKSLYNENYYLIANSNNSSSNKEKFDKLSRSLKEAIEFMKANRDESVSIVANYLAMDQKELEEIWGFYKFESEIDEESLNKLNSVIEWAKQKSNIQGEFRAQNYLPK